jgi:DNA primase catalytic core
MEIKDIKSKLSILDVLSSYNLKADRNNRVCCPWHNDKAPSLQVYPKTNTWTCFSSNCNAGSGDQIEMIQRMEKCTKHEALIKATELAGGSVTTDKGIKASSLLSRTAVITKYYQNSIHAIQRSKKGKEYAAARGLDYDKLNMGYCGYEVGKTWNKNLQENAEKLGLFKIKNCIIIPTKNKDGQIVSIYGRSVSANPKVRHFYLSGGFKGLYPSYPKSETTKLILTESIIDAATIIQHAEWPVLALYGTNGFTKEHEAAIKGLNDLEEIILFFDGDEAGKAAKEKYHKQLKELRQDIKISYVNTPDGEDANSLVQGHEPEILSHLIDSRLLFSSEKEKVSKPKSSQRGKLNTDNPELILYETDLLHITILGGIKITGLDRLRVTLKIEKKEYSHHLPVRHSLDLYHSKQVEQLAQKIAESLEIDTTESERTVSQLTGALENYRQNKLELLKSKKTEKKEMTEDERVEAIKYLKSKKLLRNTLQDIAKSGIVGETNNSLIAYLAYTSRKRKKPLHIMCLGASGTGKTYLQEKVSELIPEEDKIEITSLSDNAFYYFGREELKHKLILIEDLDGAENVLYPLRELQSKRRISKTVTLKDNKGNLKTITLRVEGPVCVSGCTTRERIYEDNANRCILLYIDDSSEQDKRIMTYQQKASAGNINASEEYQITEKIKNVQRLLKPIKVVNPYAEIIDLPQEVFKPRRTLLLLLSFIETITFYHQYQREVKTNPITGQQYIESSSEDVKAAFSLMKEALFSKSDELTNASRTFLERLKKYVKDGEVFYTSEIRKKLRISSSTIHRYVRDLKRNGYIKYKGGNKFRGYEYEITDYQEYKKLKDGIDQKLTEILSKIESIPLSQRYPTSQNGISNKQTINALS